LCGRMVKGGHIMLYGAAKLCFKRQCDYKHDLAALAKLCL
jgi:hypothetical protein